MKVWMLLAFSIAAQAFPDSRNRYPTGRKHHLLVFTKVEKRQCDYKGYIPGGNVVSVGEIKSPVATMQDSLLATVFGKTGTAADVSVAILSIKDVAPKMLPVLGAVGVAFGILSGNLQPSLEDGLKAVNEAIGVLANDINKKLDNMKGYIDGRIINSEKDLIRTEYRTKWRKWLRCVNRATKELANKCQQETEEDIHVARPKFTKHDIELLNLRRGDAMAPFKARQLEAYLITFRDYAILHLLVLKSLVDTYKDDMTRNGRSHYKIHSTEMFNASKFFVTYSSKAVEQIFKMQGSVGEGQCKDTFKCNALKSYYDGVFKLNNPYDTRECSCKVDDITKQRCTLNFRVATGDNAGKMQGTLLYTTCKFAKDNDCLSRDWADEMLIKGDAKEYTSKNMKIVRAYWKKEILDFIPRWKNAAKLAEPGMKIYVPTEDMERVHLRLRSKRYDVHYALADTF